jgi:hypothetical protein
LSAVDENPREFHAGFFPNFAADGVFYALGGFDEAREGGEPVWWPAFLTAEE